MCFGILMKRIKVHQFHVGETRRKLAKNGKSIFPEDICGDCKGKTFMRSKVYSSL